MSNETNPKIIPQIPIAISKGKPKENSILPKKSQEELEKLRNGKILFSFHFLDTNHQAFNCGRTEVSWFMHAFDNLKEISRLTRHEFIVQQRNHYDVHPHNWSKAAHNFTESIPSQTLEQISEGDQIQFRLSSSGGRVHGFMIENTFYVVWLDRHHNVYPSQRHGGPKYYDAPLTPYQELEIAYKDLERKYQNLEGEVDIIIDDYYKTQEELEKYKSAK